MSAMFNKIYFIYIFHLITVDLITLYNDVNITENVDICNDVEAV